ncbi:MAG: DNA polymerase III subunit delta' [Deltaproteobacteria bacterium]|nr:DNA polymerase III subunit delta' [Deltaproteobacteria bacterium]
MSGFETIVGQNQALRALLRILKSGRIPHSLLFSGIDGVGKRSAAVRLAMARSCVCYAAQQRQPDRSSSDNPEAFSDYPCGQCNSCLRIAAGIHPDITTIQPEAGVIKIGEIRNLCRILSMKSFEGHGRVAIISDAHLMNPPASNALLKMLEEPPEQTLLILTARQSADLLPTIVSRCLHIRFNPVSRPALSDALIQHHGFGTDEASTVAALAGGSFSRALSMKKAAWMNWRNWLITELSRLGSSPIHVILALSEKLSKNRDALSDVFEIMLSWFRDILIFTCGSTHVINRDYLAHLEEASRRCSRSDLIQIVNAVKSAQAHIEARTNIRLSLDHLLLRLWQQLNMENPRSADHCEG